MAWKIFLDPSSRLGILVYHTPLSLWLDCNLRRNAGQKQTLERSAVDFQNSAQLITKITSSGTSQASVR